MVAVYYSDIVMYMMQREDLTNEMTFVILIDIEIVFFFRYKTNLQHVIFRLFFRYRYCVNKNLHLQIFILLHILFLVHFKIANVM